METHSHKWRRGVLTLIGKTAYCECGAVRLEKEGEAPNGGHKVKFYYFYKTLADYTQNKSYYEKIEAI